MIRRFLPRSLLGQMLLAVAVALLVAQVLSGVLLYRAEQRRIEYGLINALAFQLVSDPRVDFRPADTGRNGHGRRRLRIEHATHSPIAHGEEPTPRHEHALRELLDDQGVAIDQLVVFARPISSDVYIRRILRRSPRFESNRWDLNGDILVAGLKRVGEDEWLIARVPLPKGNPRALGGVIVQTLILYVVLVGGLAFLLRRITRPLAALTRRVDRFAGRRETDDPLEPSGTEDTRRLIAAHNAMEARIAALIDEKDVMLGAIGHDLKTPLAALRVRIESVDNDEERLRMAASIEDIARTLDDILSLARIGRSSEKIERTDIAALVASVVDEYEDMGQPVELRSAPRLAMKLRATWLRRALRNLIDNALRYGERARIGLAKGEGPDGSEEVVITIEDDGPGIPEDEIAAMLEPFARGEVSRNRSTGGAGLGLTLARAIAEQHGGMLTLSNRAGADGKTAGMIAELHLPLD